MKTTRKIVISDKVFTIHDLQGIAKVFEKQKAHAKSRLTVDGRVSYKVSFADQTITETDSPELFSEEALAFPSRPVAVEMSFSDYSLNRHASVSLTHGDAPYGNLAIISATDSAWLNDTFVALKERIDATTPQTLWLRKHDTVLLNLLALGIGTLGDLLLRLVVDAVFSFAPMSTLSSPMSTLSSPFPHLGTFLRSFPVIWLQHWIFGFFWGAFPVRSWLLSAWPSIELDFGLDHLRSERIKRGRLQAVLVLIILPIVIGLIVDAILRFHHT
jgi:hypothetical protein